MADVVYLVVYLDRGVTGEQHDIQEQVISPRGLASAIITIASGVMDQAYPDLAAG